MKRQKTQLRGRELWNYARTLGISLGALPHHTPAGEDPEFADQENEYEIQRRVLEFEKHQREHRLSVIAMVATIASVLSAAAALYTAVHH